MYILHTNAILLLYSHFKEIFTCAQGDVGRDVQCRIGFNSNNLKRTYNFINIRISKNFPYSNTMKNYTAVKVNEPDVHVLA